MAHTHAKVHDLIFFLFFMSVCVFKRTRSISLLWLLGLWPPSSISGHMSHPLSLGALPHVCGCASMACYIYFFISICCFCFFLSFFETATTTAGAGSTRSPNSDVNQSSRLAPTHAGSDYTHFSLSLLFLSLSLSLPLRLWERVLFDSPERLCFIFMTQFHYRRWNTRTGCPTLALFWLHRQTCGDFLDSIARFLYTFLGTLEYTYLFFVLFLFSFIDYIGYVLRILLAVC